MSDDAAPKPEDQEQGSQLPPPAGEPSQPLDWTLAVVLLATVMLGFLFFSPVVRTSGHGATQSAKQVQAERERQIQEALRLVNDSESIP